MASEWIAEDDAQEGMLRTARSAWRRAHVVARAAASRGDLELADLAERAADSAFQLAVRLDEQRIAKRATRQAIAARMPAYGTLCA